MMDARLVALIVFACVFGSAMLGFLLGKVLPDRHLDGDSKDIVKLATGLIVRSPSPAPSFNRLNLSTLL